MYDIDFMELLGLPRYAEIVLALTPAETGTDRPFVIAKSHPEKIYCFGAISGKQRETCRRVRQTLDGACIEAEAKISKLLPFEKGYFPPIQPEVFESDPNSRIYLDIPGVTGHSDDLFIGIRCGRVFFNGNVSVLAPADSLWAKSYREFKGAYVRALSDVVEFAGAKPENMSLFEEEAE